MIEKTLKFLFRIDNFNRIIVFLSMALFMVLPSLVLFYTHDDNYSFLSVMPSLLILGLLLGNGVLVFLRPLKTSWMYFLGNLIATPLIFSCYDLSPIPGNINGFAIMIISMVYCGVGLTINLFYFISITRRKNRTAYDEKTNNDSFFDFLGGQKKNEVIARKLDEIVDENTKSKALKQVRHGKLSRITRIISYGVSFAIALIYMISSFTKKGTDSNLFGIIMILVMILSTMTFIPSLIQPTDFKYLFYFNNIFLYICAIISSRNYDMAAIFLILTIILIGLSFLITLIVEGRTWTGADTD